jgi:hypothetical protein
MLFPRCGWKFRFWEWRERLLGGRPDRRTRFWLVISVRTVKVRNLSAPHEGKMVSSEMMAFFHFISCR